jgi:Ca2+-binding EF-hand superfamily protein
MFPLPLPSHSELAFSFDKLDADGDGKVSLDELRAYCRRGGFIPVVVVVESASADDLKLAELFQRHANGDGNGKRMRPEELLRRYDLNEDESLDLAELLAAAPAPRAGEKSHLKLAEGKDADAVMHLDVGTKAPGAKIEG